MRHIITKTSLFLLTIFLLAECGQSTLKENLSITADFKQIDVGDQYSIKIPKYMKKTTSLNSDASFQSSNIFKEAYCIVIDERKDDFTSSFRLLDQYDEDKSILDNYADVQMGFISEGLTVISQTEMQETVINGSKARMLSLDGRSEDIQYDITYFFTFIEGEENIYMIMTWTLKSKKFKLRDTFNKIALSFQAIK